MGESFVKQKSILDLDLAIAQNFRLQGEDRLYISSRYKLRGGDIVWHPSRVGVDGSMRPGFTFPPHQLLDMSDCLRRQKGV